MTDETYDDIGAHARAHAELTEAEGFRSTYSYGTTPAEVIEAALPHKYAMELNRHDMLSLLAALTDGDENAMGMRSSILETLGIEEV